MMAWIAKCKYDIGKDFGFVYIISSKDTTGEYYIGCKQFKRKLGKKYKESDWAKYCSSSKKLKELIQLRGEDRFSFLMIDTAKNRTELKYKELVYQIKNNCMYDPRSLNQLLQVRINRKAL